MSNPLRCFPNGDLTTNFPCHSRPIYSHCWTHAEERNPRGSRSRPRHRWKTDLPAHTMNMCCITTQILSLHTLSFIVLSDPSVYLAQIKQHSWTYVKKGLWRALEMWNKNNNQTAICCHMHITFSVPYKEISVLKCSPDVRCRPLHRADSLKCLYRCLPQGEAVSSLPEGQREKEAGRVPVRSVWMSTQSEKTA